jgi:hypothetical protein
MKNNTNSFILSRAYINNKQHVGRESVNAWNKADFDGFREIEE